MSNNAERQKLLVKMGKLKAKREELIAESKRIAQSIKYLGHRGKDAIALAIEVNAYLINIQNELRLHDLVVFCQTGKYPDD